MFPRPSASDYEIRRSCPSRPSAHQGHRCTESAWTRVTVHRQLRLALGPRSAVEWRLVMPLGAEALQERIAFGVNHDNQGGTRRDLNFADHLTHGSLTTGHWGWNREESAVNCTENPESAFAVPRTALRG